ncbi:MAG: CPBP family intramembrane glutamic endopeptidase [Thermoanaerobaculia bacterium]
MPSPALKRFAVPVSVLLIVAYWAASAWTQLFRAGGATVPGSVRAIAGFVCIKTALAVAIVWTLLRANEECFADLGFSGRFLKAAFVWGPLVAAGVFLFVNVVLGAVLRALGTPAKPEALPALFRDVREAPLWIFLAVVGGGFTEELIRAFVLTRFERALGRIGLAIAVVVDSAIFGLGHLYQGVTAAVQSGITGLLFALIFLKRRRAADSMVVHALFDLFGIALAYLLYAAKR